MEAAKAENTARSDFKTNGQKKFCGYLRKKRNKVGGWSKLWFVLQDHLLVSYKSKEDYYNKLVSFKDVLNLMPGMQIRPLEGFNYRFTIETTTQTIYTFHCDDREAYREWISKLLACLTATTTVKGTKATKPMPIVRPMCPHFSVDDLTYAHAHITTRNFDAIIGAEPNILSRKSNVEKILERNVDFLYEHSVKRQAVKKHIERMNISGENEYRRECHPDWKERQRHSKLIAKQSSESTILELEVNDKGHKDTADNAAPTDGDDQFESKPQWHKTTIVQPEPVYAVVDLRNKYVQRKKRLMALQGKRWNSYESIFPTVIEQKEPISIEQTNEAVYEDGDVFYCRPLDNVKYFENSTKAEEENIYEPINVGEQTSPAFTLRKYISRLTLKPFIRLHHKTNNKPPDHKESKVPPIYADVQNSMKKSSKFSTMRSRFGVHRKSMQRRLRKFYGQNYEPHPLFQYPSEETPIVGNFEKTKGSIIVRAEKNHAEKSSNAIDNLPQFTRAVARISLFKK